MSIEAFCCSQPTPAQSGAATAATLLVASSPVPTVVVGFVDVVSGDAVLVTALSTLPSVPVVAPRDDRALHVVATFDDQVPEHGRRVRIGYSAVQQCSHPHWGAAQRLQFLDRCHTSGNRSNSSIVGAIVTITVSAARTAEHTMPPCSSSGGVSIRTMSVVGATIPIKRVCRVFTGNESVVISQSPASLHHSAEPCGSASTTRHSGAARCKRAPNRPWWLSGLQEQRNRGWR